MTVSVIVPLYNKRRHVRRALDSVLAQTFQDFEVVVVDDGSTDGGGDVVREMGDPRIRLIVQENAGVSAARNRGISEARGDLIAFLDADDEWEPHFLETVMSLRARYPHAGLYATAYRYCAGERAWRPCFVDCIEQGEGGVLTDYFLAARGQAPVWTSAVVVPKSVFEELGGFPVGVPRGEDRHMWARIALRYPIAWSPVNGAVYHLSADNRACVTHPPARDLPEADVIEEFLRSTPEAAIAQPSAEEYLVLRRLGLALDCHLSGNTAWAKELLAKTRGTSEYRWRRLRLQMAIRLPGWLLALIRGTRG